MPVWAHLKCCVKLCNCCNFNLIYNSQNELSVVSSALAVIYVYYPMNICYEDQMHTYNFTWTIIMRYEDLGDVLYFTVLFNEVHTFNS